MQLPMFLIFQVLVSESPALTMVKSGRVTSSINSNLLHSIEGVLDGAIVKVGVLEGVGVKVKV